MRWPVYGIHPHNPGTPCSSRCISTEGTIEIPRGSTYGIRPHLPMTPLEARQMSLTYEVTTINRPAVELLFDLCTVCKERRRHCTCHERGYN